MQLSDSHLNLPVQGRNLTTALAGNVYMTQATRAARHTLRQRRKRISLNERILFDHAIYQHLLNSGILLRCQHIAGYLANDGEPSNHAFIQRCQQTNHTYYLPVINKQKLAFTRYQADTPLANNKYGIAEPITNHTLATKFISAILLPLVGFDKQGNRLGMGGGFYDRTLNFIQRAPCHKRPLLIGIAYSVQMVKKIDRQTWDIPLDALVSEKGLLLFNNRSYNLLRHPASSK